jgi:AraC-like DNA-binding protein
VLRGQCWITLPGQEPQKLEAGDTFLLSKAPSFVLASAPGLTEAEDAEAVFGNRKSSLMHYRGDDTVLIGGGFIFETGNSQLLLDALPAFVFIPASEPASAILSHTLQLLDAELANGDMGASLMMHHLADILLVQALRVYVALRGPQSAGWIGALNDHRVGTALKLMHGDVRRNWRVDELAAAAGMSRSGFALRFKQLVGTPPLDYLLHWRMQLAQNALRRDNETVASLADRLGYASESAFGNAFKRVSGHAPKRYRQAIGDEV